MVSFFFANASILYKQEGGKFNAHVVKPDSTRTESSRVTTHGRDRHFVTSHLRDRLIPAVVTTRNTPGTHFNSATGRSVRQECAT